MVVLVLVMVFIFFRKGKSTQVQNANLQPTEEVIPTVDSSVVVSLKNKIGSKDVVLSINGMPKATSSVEYSLSYSTVQQGIQGVIGTVKFDKNENSYEKSLVLGTCSSGTCVYHQVVGNITVSLKFSGNYGAKVFEKEFTLSN